jgi:hypothetical protein
MPASICFKDTYSSDSNAFQEGTLEGSPLEPYHYLTHALSPDQHFPISSVDSPKTS